MKQYKGFFAWAAACVWAVGTIGGVAVSITAGYWFIGLCVAAVAAGAVPFVVKLFKSDDSSE